MQTLQQNPGCPPLGSEPAGLPVQCRNCEATFFTAAEAILCPACNDNLEFGTVQVEIPCQDCQKPFKAAGLKMGTKTKIFGKFCQTCSDSKAEREAAAKKQAIVDAKEKNWLTICPEYYRTPEIVEAVKSQIIECPEQYRKPGEGAGATIKKTAVTAAAIKARRGCLLFGESGTFKTTAMLQGAVKQLIWQGEEVLFVFAADFKNDASRAAKECRIPEWIRPMVKVPWLFLDDLGNMADTPGAADGLNALLEARKRACLPLLATTQYTGPRLVGRFAVSERGESMVRRILQMTGPPIKFP